MNAARHAVGGVAAAWLTQSQMGCSRRWQADAVSGTDDLAESATFRTSRTPKAQVSQGQGQRSRTAPLAVGGRPSLSIRTGLGWPCLSSTPPMFFAALRLLPPNFISVGPSFLLVGGEAWATSLRAFISRLHSALPSSFGGCSREASAQGGDADSRPPKQLEWRWTCRRLGPSHKEVSTRHEITALNYCMS